MLKNEYNYSSFPFLKKMISNFRHDHIIRISGTILKSKFEIIQERIFIYNSRMFWIISVKYLIIIITIY